MKVNFYLQGNLDNNGHKHLYINIAMNGKRVQFLAKGLKINPDDWDKKRQRIKWNNSVDKSLKHKRAYKDRNEYMNTINAKLDMYEKEVMLIAQQNNDLDKIVSETKLKLFGKNEKVKGVIETYREFLNIKNYKDATKKSHQTTINKLKDFSQKTKNKLKFANIDLLFVEQFQSYLKQEGYEHNSVSKYVRQFKTFLLWCNERDITNIAKLDKINTAEKEKEPIALTEEEFKKIIKFPLDDVELNTTRDLLIFGVLTGQRIGDYFKMDLRHIKEINGVKVWINPQQKKNGQYAHVKLNKKAVEILNKYGTIQNAINAQNPQTVNKRLKRLFKACGIDEKVKITKYINNKVVEEYVPKYEIASTKFFRKTFITLSKFHNVPDEAIVITTGHKKMEMLKHYNDVNVQHLLNKQETFLKVYEN